MVFSLKCQVAECTVLWYEMIVVVVVVSRGFPSSNRSIQRAVIGLTFHRSPGLGPSGGV